MIFVIERIFFLSETMNNLQKLNILGGLDYKIVKLYELEQQKPYSIQHLRTVDTVHGRRILVTFDTNESVWLPERFQLSDSFLDEVNNGAKMLLIYKGKRPLTGGKQVNDIEFKYASSE